MDKYQQIARDHGHLVGKVVGDDPEFSLALVRAYNDWHIDEWCGSYPGRFIPMALPVIWDPEACAKEIRRVAEKGCHSFTFSENPAVMGFPSFHDEHWDPVWRAMSDTGAIMNVHIGSSGKLTITAVDAPPDVMITLQPMNIVNAAADLLWSRPIKQFPDVKIALSRAALAGSRTSPSGWTRPSRCTRPGRAAERDRHRQHLLGVRLPALGLDVGGAGVGRGP
jgi:predicted TIM-barrel fold metal-dependent hydrolase